MRFFLGEVSLTLVALDQVDLLVVAGGSIFLDLVVGRVVLATERDLF